MSSAAGSVSRIPVTFEVHGKGSAKCELVRHLAPLSIVTIVRNLPLHDNIHKFGGNFVYINTNLTIGAEKQKTQFRRGDIAFMLASSAVCVFVKDSTVAPMNHIGRVIENVEIFESLKPGEVMELKK